MPEFYAQSVYLVKEYCNGTDGTQVGAKTSRAFKARTSNDILAAAGDDEVKENAALAKASSDNKALEAKELSLDHALAETSVDTK